MLPLAGERQVEPGGGVSASGVRARQVRRQGQRKAGGRCDDCGCCVTGGCGILRVRSAWDMGMGATIESVNALP